MLTSPRRIAIGMMRSYPDPDPTAVAAAHVAVLAGADFFFFGLGDVDIASRTVLGAFYESGQWRRRRTSFPDVVDNEPRAPSRPDAWQALIAGARATTPNLGGKWECDARLRGSGRFADLLIPTLLLGSVDDLISGIEGHQRVVVKPVHGSRGREVMFFAKTDQGYYGSVNGRNWHFDADALGEIYGARLQGREFLLQKYIDSSTKKGLPFDFRLHIRRDGRAEWKLLKIWARIGSGRSIAANSSAGGSVTEAPSFLRNRYGAAGDDLHRMLVKLAYDFAPAFQAVYEDRGIDALGIDIGLDPAGRPWLFEVNTFPSPAYIEIQDAVPRIGYALYLANNPHVPDGALRT